MNFRGSWVPPQDRPLLTSSEACECLPACMYMSWCIHFGNEAKRRHENWTYRQCTGNPFWVLCRSSLCPCLYGRASALGPRFCLLVFLPAASPFCFSTFPPVSHILDIFLKLTFSFCHEISWFTKSPSFGDLTLSGKLLRTHVLNSPDLCFLGT